MSRNCLVVDLDKCIGCHACEVACKNENGIALGEYWNRVLQIGPHGTFPDADGKVLVDKEKCIGCKYCMMACPYGVRSWNTKEKAVEKCTLCGQLTSAGQEPACVGACCANARFYGDLDDPNSDVSKAVAAADPASLHTLHDAGNKPLTRYILSDKIATWHDVDAIKPASDAQDAAWFAKEA